MSVAELTDNLLIYQAELEIQNEELRRAQVDEQRAIARFTTLFARIPLAVLVVDRTGLILQANEAADHLFGLQAHHLSQRFLHRLLESPRNALGQVLVDVRTTGVSLARSVAFRTAGGGRFVGDLHMTRLPAMEGDDRQFVCAVVDLTEQLKRQTELQAAEERLRRSEARNRILADFSPDWEYWIGTDGQYVYVSPACQQVSGYSAAEFMADPELFKRILHPEDQARYIQHLALACSSQQLHGDQQLEFRILARDGGLRWGQLRWIEHVCRAVTDSQGRYLGQRGVNRDITSRVLAEAALRESEMRYRLIAENATDLIVLCDKAGVLLYVSPAAKRLVGYRPEELIGRNAFELLHPDDAMTMQALQDKVLNGAGEFAAEHRLRRCDGQLIWVETRTRSIVIHPDTDPTQRILAITRDITERRQTEERRRQVARLFESTAEGMVITDANNCILAVNQAFTAITGYAEEEALGQTPRLLKSGRHDPLFYQTLWTTLLETGQWRGEIWNRRKNGELYPEWKTISVVRDPDGRITHYVAVFSDITAQKKSQETLDYLAHHDPLTGLPNRTLFRARLEHGLQRAKRDGGKLALLFLDLDRFKNLNDTIPWAMHCCKRSPAVSRK